jgi:tetraacyldisaccharide 4'-kinase
LIEQWWHRHLGAWWLAPLSFFYGLGLRFNRPKPIRVNTTVVSIGNLTVGGSGKTPLILALAERLSKKYRVAVVSRGYKGTLRVPTLICDGAGPLAAPEKCGDEPYLIATQLPHLRIAVGRDRVAAARLVEDADLILLDDGMQHRRLHRDADLVLVSPRDLTDHLFPRGRLREPISALKRAQLAICTEGMVKEIPALSAEIVPRDPPDLEGKRVALYCGIARPERFRNMVKSLGGNITSELFLGDHQPITESQLRSLAKDADLILCTEKDWVKRPQIELPIPHLPLPVELQFSHPQLIDQFFIDLIRANS